MARILLTGSQGQVGHELQRQLPAIAEVVALDRQHLDLSQPDHILGMVTAYQPDIIVNAAAYTAVDQAETAVSLAETINGVAPRVLAATAQSIGATLVHLSTDYVFDGTQGHPYTEQDPAHPLNVYGHSKVLGEQGVRAECERHILLRTAWVYGAHGKGNFVKTMLRLGAEREQLRVVADQIGAPTWAWDLARAITQLLQVLMATDPAARTSLYGTYHYTNSGVASWYDFAIAIFAEAHQLGIPLQVKQVLPIATPDYPTPAQRPLYSLLSCGKMTQLLGEPPPHWRESLRNMLTRWSQSASPSPLCDPSPLTTGMAPRTCPPQNTEF